MVDLGRSEGVRIMRYATHKADRPTTSCPRHYIEATPTSGESGYRLCLNSTVTPELLSQRILVSAIPAVFCLAGFPNRIRSQSKLVRLASTLIKRRL